MRDVGLVLVWIGRRWGSLESGEALVTKRFGSSFGVWRRDIISNIGICARNDLKVAIRSMQKNSSFWVTFQPKSNQFSYDFFAMKSNLHDFAEPGKKKELERKRKRIPPPYKRISKLHYKRSKNRRNNGRERAATEEATGIQFVSLQQNGKGNACPVFN